MAICRSCGQEMLVAETCTHLWAVTAEGVSFRRIPYRTSAGWDDGDEVAERCHDCGVAKGGIHHPSCDMERCPSCSQQMLQCACFDGGGTLETDPVPRTDER